MSLCYSNAYIERGMLRYYFFFTNNFQIWTNIHFCNYGCANCVVRKCIALIPSEIAYSMASKHTLLCILVHANLFPRRSEHIRYGAISRLSPRRCCLLSSNDSTMKTQEAAESNGPAIDASVSDCKLGDILTLPSSLLTPSFPPTGRKVSLYR